MMTNIRKLFASMPYIFGAHAWDTVNLRLIAATYMPMAPTWSHRLTTAHAECRALRKLGTTIMDGDDGELSIRFTYTPETWQAVRRIMRPWQSAAILQTAA